MLLIAFVVILLIFFIYQRHQQMTLLSRLGIPGPKPNFILGNSLEIAKDNFIGVFPKWTEKYGPIVGFYIGGRPQVLITDFELIRHVMIKDFNVFSNKHQYIPGGIHPQPQLQKMLVWSLGNEWRQLRASMSPSFSLSKLNAMHPLMMSSIDILANSLDEKANGGQEFNLRPLVWEYTFSTATKCIFGLNFSMNNNETDSFVKATRPGINTSILAMTMVLFPSLTFIAHPLRVLWETIRLHMLWSPEGVCYDIAKKIVQFRKDTKNKSNDFLQSLIDAKMLGSTDEMDHEMSLEDKVTNTIVNNVNMKQLSEEVIISNALLFLLAGNETISTTLQFIIHNLVNHQDVQSKLRKELQKLVINDSCEFNLQTLSKVPLLTHVINETLRMFPPVSPFTARVADKDYKYQDILIPQGTGVFIGVSSIHNDPELWPQANQFQPERFESEYDKLAFLPFGGGPRNCIGMRFAYMELQLTLAKLLLKFKFEPGPSTEKNIETTETFATLIPKNGVFCKVSKLDE